MINNKGNIEEVKTLAKENSATMEFEDNIEGQEQFKIIATNEGEKSEYLLHKTILALSTKSKIFFKTCIFLIAIGFLFMGKSLGVPQKSYPIIHDPIMYDVLDGMNTQMNANRDESRSFQISSSLCMDLSFFAMYIYWVIYINTGRLLYATGAFYVLRGIVQNFVTFPFPDGYFWEDPGFPSLTVPYGHTSDFFWSGHCGFLMLVACEWFVQKKYYMCGLTCLINLYMGIVMIGFRIHYTVDVIIGVFMAHYCYLLFSKAAPYIDEFAKRIFDKVWSLTDKARNNSSISSLSKQDNQPIHPGLFHHENKL